jgi:glycosyltransferase involved in cell wall biosynthesis
MHRRRPFDVLHGLWADEPGFLAVIAGRLVRVPSLVSVLGGELVGMPEIGYGGQLSRINRWLIQFAIDQADFVSAGSKYLGEIVRSDISDRHTMLIPLGVDSEMFHHIQTNLTLRTEDGYRLINVGSLSRVKDQSTLLHGFALISEKYPNVRLDLVGGGPLRPPLENLVASLGINQQVKFHGEVSHERLVGYYQASDLFVTSSRYESQGMVVLEAAACGLPTVGTAVGLLPELEGSAITVPVGDYKALAQAALQLLEDDDRRIEMGRIARRLVEKKFSINQTVENLLNAYQRLIARRTPGKSTN